MYWTAGKCSRHFWKCDLLYLGTDSWKSLFSVLLVLVIIFKKKKLIPPKTRKLISCHPVGHHKWKHFRNEKTDQNMFHFWWLQIQGNKSLELTVFWVRNILMRVNKLESSLFQSWSGQKKREKSGKLKSLLPLGVLGCTADQAWSGSWHSTEDNLLSSPNLYRSQTNLLTRQRQPGERVLAWRQENTSHTAHSHSSVSHSGVSSPCPFTGLNILPMEEEGKDSSAIRAPLLLEELCVPTQSHWHTSFQCSSNTQRSLVNFEEATCINNLVSPWQSWLNYRNSCFLTQKTQT